MKMWFAQMSLNIFLILLLLMCHENKFHRWKVEAQLSAFKPTVFDNTEWRLFFHLYRNITMMMAGRTGLKTRGNFLQTPVPESAPFPCDTAVGRSREPPSSVHKLRPGDVNVIAAIGDSVITASGASATSFLELYTENRGLSWCIGGQWNWRNATTLPNILKVYNPKLVGYSYRDSYSFHWDSQFNNAEIGAISKELPHMARQMVTRIKSDRRVNFKKDWKILTLTIGGNDICAYVCTMKNPESLPMKHRRNLLATLRYLRDNLPRTFVNIVSMPDVEKVASLAGKPAICWILHHGECPCWVGPIHNSTESSRSRWARIQKQYKKVEEEVPLMDEFRGLDEFAVVHQPWTKRLSLNDDKGVDFTLLSYDCFHMSQKGHARAAAALWNNMLEPPGKKRLNWDPPYVNFRCPSQQNPYFYTYDNS
ncbi:phospholipase B1, membrane-associated [Aedes aegypti]|uniref:Uncharacterized protein n=1 Tax=Aedes aegypti TaxID=7159 RepID=A0A6I8TC37_AEDAE|nr:phospholipase B1, membrane-associated [Aedes aegypti]XP_021707468.1 phospholipase B1, membrane-associated [Aedes aegypti]